MRSSSQAACASPRSRRAFTSASFLIYAHTDRLMLGYFHPEAVVGQFAVARNVIDARTGWLLWAGAAVGLHPHQAGSPIGDRAIAVVADIDVVQQRAQFEEVVPWCPSQVVMTGIAGGTFGGIRQRRF